MQTYVKELETFFLKMNRGNISNRWDRGWRVIINYAGFQPHPLKYLKCTLFLHKNDFLLWLNSFVCRYLHIYMVQPRAPVVCSRPFGVDWGTEANIEENWELAYMFFVRRNRCGLHTYMKGCVCIRRVCVCAIVIQYIVDWFLMHRLQYCAQTMHAVKICTAVTSSPKINISN